MARDRQIEVGAISREPHAIAFSACCPPRRRVAIGMQGSVLPCLAFLDYEPSACVFVSRERADLEETEHTGCACYAAGWLGPVSGSAAIRSPANIFGSSAGGTGYQEPDSGSTSE